MSTKIVIQNKISAIKKYVSILKRYDRYSQKKLEQDIDIRGAVERYLYLAVQSVIDCAEAVIALKKFRKPTTISDTFYILQEEDVLSSNLTNELVKMAGFRNIIAHDYEKIDYGIVYDILHHKRSDIRAFIKIITAYCRL